MMNQWLDDFIKTIAKKKRFVVKKDFDKHETVPKC